MTSAEILAVTTIGSFWAGFAFMGTHRNARCTTIACLIKWIPLTIVPLAAQVLLCLQRKAVYIIGKC